MDLKNTLKEALAFEQKGHDIYKATAKKTSNSVVKATFNYLAEEELKHKDAIKGYIEKEKIDISNSGNKKEDTEKFFTTTVNEFKEKTRLSSDDLKAHETALELEKSSYNFYKELHKKSDTQELKKFFKFLMEQENTHYELIQKAYWYVKDPTGFYAEEEQWFIEGG
ncbi:ferritin family protein [Candidatus Woesearchaeota archaeon]|nr:ferritin family protein [Candidatus Woesearchaeota archaeon]